MGQTNISKSAPRDVFLYLLTIITLYISIWRFITLLFEYVNVKFPDELYFTNSLDEIRISIASLVIVFPVYLSLTWFLRKDAIAHPEKLQMKIRKWLLNFTLFLAAITIIVDLIILINNFLQGELTLRFILKVLVVLLVAGAVFSYYLWDLKRETSAASRPSKLLAWLTSIIIFGSIASGFFIIGSPSKQRTIRFDERRVSDLSRMQGEIMSYYQRNEKLPQTLEDLRSDFMGFVAPVDPDTKKPYGYKPLEELKFELCADFGLPTQTGTQFREFYYPMPVWNDGYSNDNFSHEAGRQCFSRVVDKSFFPPRPIKY